MNDTFFHSKKSSSLPFAIINKSASEHVGVWTGCLSFLYLSESCNFLVKLDFKVSFSLFLLHFIIVSVLIYFLIRLALGRSFPGLFNNLPCLLHSVMSPV